MKRTGFHRQVLHFPRAGLVPLERQPNYARSAATAAPIAKHDYIRNEALRVAYRLIACQHCGANDGTVCGAHSNWQIHGKGGHIKADDNRAASLCYRCHICILDQGSKLSEDERKRMWWNAHRLTVHVLTLLEIWPAGVPVPDVAVNPFGT